MRILQVNNYYEIIGGSETVFRETIDSLRVNNHEVFYFSTSFLDTNNTSKKGVILKSVDFKKYNLFKQITTFHQFIFSRRVEKAFEQYVLEINPDIIHLHIFYGQLTNAILKVIKKHKIPTVMSVHEYKMICSAYTLLNGKGEVCEKCGGKNFYHAVINKCNKRNILYSTISSIESYYQKHFFPYSKIISHFIMVSDFIRQKHIKYFPNIKHKSSVISNFVNLDNYPFNESNTEFEYVYFGRISKEKGLITLLESINAISNVSLKVIGTGPLYEDVSSRYASEHIEFLGYLSGSELKEYVSKAKFVIVPSEWYENNPMTIIESFALGTPVIGSNIGGIPELVLNTKTGFLFNPGSVTDLTRAITLSQQLKGIDYLRMRRECRLFAEENLNSENYYNQLISVYNSILK